MSVYCLTTAVAALLTAPAASSPAVEVRLSKPAYELKVQTAYARVQAAFRATRGRSGAALAAEIAGAQRTLREAADELAAARPPSDVVEENRALAEAMRSYARALDDASRAAARGDHATLATFADASTNAAVRELAEAAEKMKYKGYRLGPIAKD